TTSGLALFTTFAGLSITIVTGSGPQSKTILPPWATASTTASQSQLSGVPSPITTSGLETSLVAAAAGIGESPSGLPAAGPSSGFSKGLGTSTMGPGFSTMGFALSSLSEQFQKKKAQKIRIISVNGCLYW